MRAEEAVRLLTDRLRVIDLHVHFPANPGGGFRQRHPRVADYAHERDARMAAEWDFPPAEPWATTAEQVDEYARRWAEEVDRYRLERVVFVTGGGNDTLHRVLRHHPRFLGMAHHSPTSPGATEELRRCVEELGMVGYKVIGPRVEVPFEDPSLRPLWTYCADRRLPVLIHFGLLGHAGGLVAGPRMSPLSLYPVASEFADIPFIIPHFGCGYMRDLLHLCWSCPNVYVDTSGSNQWMRWMPYPLDIQAAFQKFYETIGPKRIVFGTDSSWFPRGFVYRYLQDQVRACRYLNMKEEDIQDIFGGNAARLLGIKL
ncbi:MAG: amidohydrolase [Clostridia bacterium]|nr:amidohydrolase [Clostridia bacterium]